MRILEEKKEKEEPCVNASRVNQLFTCTKVRAQGRVQDKERQTEMDPRDTSKWSERKGNGTGSRVKGRGSKVKGVRTACEHGTNEERERKQG